MKRILSLAVAASMLLSAIPAMAETATEATYIPAPYNAEEVDPTILKCLPCGAQDGTRRKYQNVIWLI